MMSSMLPSTTQVSRIREQLYKQQWTMTVIIQM
ncbi:hypothetical protein DNTS_020907 [Danionella cerebrum]|uniref:Uncharacterized protein n=1 Tax=Danionella cerebrum TaxID=2873325 RepID=A0A553PX25_9TELE|nr:hypothetical protein DNTS_020907 [Danionella translucida]